MIKYLKISNIGELDIRLVALMGGTTKSGKEGLIGEFGSGLKCTLAWLLRNNVAFHIYSGESECNITTEGEIIGDTQFDIICINGQRTSITANMGKEWLSWMIVRELWANAIDEGDPAREVKSTVQGEDGRTTIYIQVTPEIQQVLEDWNRYFIHDQIPMSSTHMYKLYPGGNKLRIYKQGILIHEDEEMKSLFAYDIHYASINELREFTGSPMYYCAEAIKNAEEKAIKYYLENISEEYWEGKRLDYDWISSKWSAKWQEVLGSARIIHQKAIDNSKAKGIPVDEKDYIVVPEKVYKALTSQFEGIGALKMVQKGSEFYEQYCEKTENRIKQALTILETCEYPMHEELQFKYGFFADRLTQALIKIDEKTIYISQGLLQQPLTDIVAVLIEENEHFNTGYGDHTREFQTHLLKLYTRQLLKTQQIEI